MDFYVNLCREEAMSFRITFKESKTMSERTEPGMKSPKVVLDVDCQTIKEKDEKGVLSQTS